MYSLAVQELLITITTQSAANEPGLGWAGLDWAGVGGGCQRGAQRGRTGQRLERTALYCLASIGRNVGHPPAFPLCLTLNLVAGMRKGKRQQQQQWKKRKREEEVEKMEKEKGKKEKEEGASIFASCEHFSELSDNKQKQQELQPGAKD